MMAKRKRNLGKAFADMISSASSKGASIADDQINSSSLWQESILPQPPVTKIAQAISNWRIVPLAILLIAILAIFTARLFKLQAVEGEYNRSLADGNRIQIRTIHAPRGVIYDREGLVLARNTAGFRLIAGDKVQFIDRDTALALESQNLATESLEGGPLGRLEVDTIREYTQPESNDHLLGFTSQISAEELKSSKFANYQAGDRIGRLGIEETYEQYLAGYDGQELIEVDAAGAKLRNLGTVEALAGNALHLTIDAKLQEIAYSALEKGINKASGPKTGAVVAANPKTGEILSLVSYPGFNNNLLTNQQLTQEQYDQLAGDPRKPFLNRVTQGFYPPGSIFKIVSAIAGLESGKIDKSTEIEDVGEFYLGDQRFPNWYFIQYGRKEGLLNIVRAIARSNDIFFYRVGQSVGVELLAKFAQKLGLGRTTGVDLPSEVEGLVPTPEWKERVKGEIWFPGNTLHMAIGQGDVLVTPLQIVNLTSYVANGGTLYQPHLVSSIVSSQDNKLIMENKPKIMAKDLTKPENLALVQRGMKEACSQGGTGWPFFDFGQKYDVEVGCKTGTAEHGVANPHAWFTVFAPFTNPEIALTVLVEQGGEGSSVAGPIAKEILGWYFSGK